MFWSSVISVPILVLIFCLLTLYRHLVRPNGPVSVNQNRSQLWDDPYYWCPVKLLYSLCFGNFHWWSLTCRQFKYCPYIRVFKMQFYSQGTLLWKIPLRAFWDAATLYVYHAVLDNQSLIETIQVDNVQSTWNEALVWDAIRIHTLPPTGVGKFVAALYCRVQRLALTISFF